MTYEDLVEIAESYENKCEWSKALNIYRQIYRQTPSSKSLEKIAWCNSRNGDYQKAKAACEKLLENEPGNPRWLYMYGFQFYMEKDWCNAVVHFDKALESNPDYFVVLYRSAYALIKLAGDYKKLTKSEYWKAIGYLKRAHKIWEEYPPERRTVEASTYYLVNFVHGKALMLIKNHNDEAIHLFKIALTLKDNPDCKYNLSKALFFSGQYEQAKIELPNTRKYYVSELAAQIEYKLGNYDEAFTLVEKLITKRPKDYLLCLAASIKTDQEKYRDAYKFAKQAVDVNSKNHKNHFTLAQAYFKLCLLNKALASLDKAENLKSQKYGGDYQACADLRKQIHRDLTPEHTDDDQLITSLEGEPNLAPPRCIGTLTQYNENKGFGFVLNGNQHIFVHISKCRGGRLWDGAKLQYRIEITDKGQQAVDISVIR